MTPPSLSPEQVQQVSALVADYITSQRRRYIPRDLPLSTAQRRAMSEFFSPELLDSTRLLVFEGERVQNPDFYPMLRSLGFHNLPDQTTVAAVTFVDTVVSHEPFSDGLLFHELVHVEQY